MRMTLAIALAAFFLCAPALGAPWMVSVDDRNGLPILSKGGATAISSTFAFWGANWAWAGQEAKFKVEAPFEYSVAAKNHVLDFDLRSRIRKPSARQLVWEFELNARKSTRDAIGGGIAFKFDLASFSSDLGEPELLPENRGWAWGHAGRSRVEMRFDPPLASVYFERGRKTEVRAFFYKGEVPAGERRHIATLSVLGNAAIGPSISERFGLDDHTAWPADFLDWKTSPVDLSFLNAPERPAGKRGFLKVVGDKLAFEDGTVSRFWGTNLTAYALFTTSREAVIRQARRLSELGFNLVRLHHHDSDWVSPNVFGDKNGTHTRDLNSAAMEKLDWWIKCLKDEGIYVWLDLHVGRPLKPGDGIDDFEEISKGKPSAQLPGFNYVNPSIADAMKRFNEAYLRHVNVHTRTAYAEEPAIVAVLITNENDVTHHFGNSLLPDKKVPRHNARYMAQAEIFAARHRLPKDRTWRAWEHGPSKIFLNDLEQRFNADLIGHLRALGVKVPIVTTSAWGDNPLSSLPALTAGTLIDAHSYGGVGELEKNPIYAPNLIHWAAAAQVAGRPSSVSEWNVEAFPAPDRHGIPLYVAASAAHQGWSAVVQYAYAQVSLDGPGRASNWHAFNDPALLATLPAGALLFRQGHVREAETTYAYAPSASQLFNDLISPANAAGLRTAVERGKLVIALPKVDELPWLGASPLPRDARLIADPKRALIDGAAREAVSDTRELRRNWDEGTYTIDTPRTQAATGWIGGKRVTLANVDIAMATRNVSVVVQSLDGKPIGASRRILISLGARAIPGPGNRVPFFSEPVAGTLTIRAPQGLKLEAVSASGEASADVPAAYKGGRYQVNLDRALGSRWLLLRP